MGKSHPIALRVRVAAFVEEGHSHREAARHFRVSPRFVNNLMILKRATGSGGQAGPPMRVWPSMPWTKRFMIDGLSIAATSSTIPTGACNACQFGIPSDWRRRASSPPLEVGDSYDNVLAETINGLHNAEVIHRRGPWRNFEAVEFATLEWVDWFNKTGVFWNPSETLRQQRPKNDTTPCGCASHGRII